MSTRLWVLLGSFLFAACEPPRSTGEAMGGDADESELFLESELGGLGSLRVRGDEGESGLVELERVHVRATQQGDFAEVEVEHVFHSEANVVLEGTFRFPLPEQAILTGLSLWIDGKEQRGELVEHEKARRVFEQIVDAMQDPALLEWEHASTFKMRVFPIAPHEHKRLMVRYLTPLHQTKRGLVFAHVVSAPRHGALRHAQLDWQGQRLFEAANLTADRRVEAPAVATPSVLAEERPEGSYLVARVRPDWSQVPRDRRPQAKSWLVIADTSRSALEERPLLLESIRTLITGLPQGSRFVVATSDLDLTVDPRGFLPVSAINLDAALAFVEATSSEGATDIDAALVGAGALLRQVQDAAVLYVGDCQPTWGEVRPDKLAERAQGLLAGAPFHALLLGKQGDAVAAALVDRTAGQWLRARSDDQVRAFARSLSRPVRQLRELTLSTSGDALLVDDGRKSIAFGEELTVALRTEPGKAAPTTLHVAGKAAGTWVRFAVPLRAVHAPRVAQRFGALLVKQLERSERPKEDVVSASLQYGVMSKYTSLLVLESEQAYAQYDIARRAPQLPDAPRITGGDLESATTEGASINLDRIQPGDPEIYVHAPEDARSVKVSFPFGQTKEAHYDPEASSGQGAWMVRFLVPLETPEGTYGALVQVVHRDGQSEAMTVTYTVDRTPPELDVHVQRQRKHPAWVAIRVAARGVAKDSDLRRVEVRTPDGTIRLLRAVRWGEFVGRLAIPPGQAGSLRIVGVDQALNHSVRDVEVP